VPLSEAEFEQRTAARLFALHWRSHGCRYGVGVEIDTWLARGFAVVVNGSRRSYGEARRRYPGLVAVLLTVQPSRLQQRRLACGRGDRGDFDASLDREVLALDPQCVRIANDGPVGEAGDALLQVLTGRSAVAERTHAASGQR
jgi:ribose 1,5-bisphosphokinase